MPRQKTEASVHLEMYKLVNERTRLQQELEAMEQRRDRIHQRLEILNVQVAALEKSTHPLGDAETPKPQHVAKPKASSQDNLNTFLLEY